MISTTLQKIKRAGILTLNDAIILDDLRDNGESNIGEIQARTRVGYSTVNSCLIRLADCDLVCRRRFRMGHVYKLTDEGSGCFQ